MTFLDQLRTTDAAVIAIGPLLRDQHAVSGMIRDPVR